MVHWVLNAPLANRLAVSLKYFESQKCCAMESRGNETCYLWQRSTSEKLVLDLSETYICGGGSSIYLFLSKEKVLI